MHPSLTVVINTYNEETNIGPCIESAQLLTTDIVVIDMHSTDTTATRAKDQGAQIHTFPFSHYVEPARAFAIEQAQGDWVFILDADERMTPQLAEEIQNTLSHNTHTYYKIPRKNIFGKKKWLKHGGWWPDHQMRLIQKKAFRRWPQEIHSTPEIEGEMGYLQEPFLHYFHGDFHRMVEKTMIFEDIEAGLLYNAGRKVSTGTFFRKFGGELYRRLIKHRGFLDGNVGIIEAMYQAFSKTITYLYLYEKKKSSPL